MRTPEAAGVRPLVVYVCADCGRVLETRELGLHDLRGGAVGDRCSGPLEGPLYVVDVDDWLDTLIALERL